MNKIFVLTMLLAIASPLFGSQCNEPLDERTLNQLQLGQFGDVQLQPGQSKQFQLAILSSYAPDTKVAACVVWELKPTAQGATIDQNGLLKIESNTIVPVEKGFTWSRLENLSFGQAAGSP